MKITLEKNHLMNAINIVSRAIASNSPMEILECILVETTADDVRLIANDTELAIETHIPAVIEVPGKIALKARFFADVIRKLPDSELVIETDEKGMTNITCERIHFNIGGLTGDDFSRLPQVEKEKKVVISQFDFKEMIRQTIFSVSDNANSRLMTGELLSISDNVLTVTSLDGHRISVRKKELAGSNENMEVIVPGKTLAEVSRILPGEAEDEVSLYVTENHILFEFEQTKVVSRLLEGKFYNITQMLSADYETKVIVNKNQFHQCLDRSTLFVRDSSRKPVIMKFEDDQMNLTIASQFGSMNDQLQIVKEGKDLTIGFDPKFLVDALRVIDDEEVSLYLINPIAPCIIRNDDGSYFYLILPINVNNNYA